MFSNFRSISGFHPENCSTRRRNRGQPRRRLEPLQAIFARQTMETHRRGL